MTGWSQGGELRVQVGQLLLFLRISPRNRLLPFVTQLVDLVCRPAARPGPGADTPAAPGRGPKQAPAACCWAMPAC